MKRKKYLSIGIALLVIISVCVYVSVVSAEPTISIVQDKDVTTVGQQVVMSIKCNPNPSEPMKAFEFKLKFNPDYYRADLVTEGDIFRGYQTFFSSGIIDNVNGTIINIYDLILGQGNVTESGFLANITFTCLQLKTSPLTLYDVGITNESDYINITVQNGQIKASHNWDINKDGLCNIFDVMSISNHYGEKGTLNWIPEDLFSDGIINILDLLVVSFHYGEVS
jgi:hypothetical protein